MMMMNNQELPLRAKVGLNSSIDIGQLQKMKKESLLKARPDLQDSIMKQPNILDDYKMGMTFTAMPHQVGPGDYTLPSIFQPAVTSKEVQAPRFSFSKCPKDKIKNQVVSIKHLNDLLGKDSPGTGKYLANYQSVLKNSRKCRINLTEDRFGSYWKRRHQERSPGPIYGFAHSRDTFNQKNLIKSIQFGKARRFSNPQMGRSPSPNKYNISSEFSSPGSKVRGPSFGSQIREARDPVFKTLSMTMNNFKNVTSQKQKKNLQQKILPGPGQYKHQQQNMDKNNYKFSFPKGKRFLDPVHKNISMSGEDLPRNLSKSSSKGIYSFGKQKRNVNTRTWGLAYLRGSIKPIF